MKIYDIVEGKWLEDKKSENEKEIKDYEDFGLRTCLVSYDEEKDWIRREKEYVRSNKKILDN
tara:strand:+ start:2967 stop:3152 length:186 start_codon:yes stop_codon:yes gene_type:complete